MFSPSLPIVFPLPPKLRAITEPSLTSVTNYYVYEWHNNGLAFYVGYGKLRKAWNLHNLEAEDTKRFSKEFKVVIVQDNLNKDQAQELKKRLIAFYRSQNQDLANVR
jgi:hypothetical protein